VARLLEIEAIAEPPPSRVEVSIATPWRERQDRHGEPTRSFRSSRAKRPVEPGREPKDGAKSGSHEGTATDSRFTFRGRAFRSARGRFAATRTRREDTVLPSATAIR